MEIFDADGDGVYELAQFDSCLRYFLEDCGSCSPEPRAYFKYDSNLKQYSPAKGVVQDFVREYMEITDRTVREKYPKLKESGKLSADVDFYRNVLSHVADLLHMGEEKKAWKFFDEFYDDSSGKARKELKGRLSACRYYQALQRASGPTKQKR